ncbi:MAG: HutD family protein [Reyranella sp.]|jgi:environmental stress-induced protein Ves|nr:HutD family protein [Reyranella sp.]
MNGAKELTVIVSLDPAGYVRTPWKNGGGVTTDIACDGDVWRFSRTPITVAGPFSDYTGFDRLQVLIAGSGLVLQTPPGEIDVRRPFRPVRFTGETPIVSRLEAGPVEVINLMGERARVALDLQVLDAGDSRRLGPGIHIAYCPAGRASLRLRDGTHELPADGGVRIEDWDGVATCLAGPIVLGSVTCVSR